MTACLRCDQCGSVAAEHDTDLRQWWRLARHGLEWAEEAGIPRVREGSTSYNMSTVFVDGTSFVVADEDEEDEDYDLDALLISSDFDEDPDTPSPAVLHFCKASCLAKWASMDSQFES